MKAVRHVAWVAGAIVLAAPAYAADGCGPGTSSTVVSPDGNATSTLFDDYSAEAGGDSGVSAATTSCSIGLPATVPGGYSVFAVDYRGFVALEDGQTASLTRRNAKGEIFLYTGKDALQADVVASERVGSAHGATLDTRLTANGPADPDLPPAQILLDSIDVARIGFTTAASVSASVDQLADGVQAAALTLAHPAATLLGAAERIDGGSYIAATAGSAFPTGGGRGRWTGDNGFSLLGGATAVGTAPDAGSQTSALLLAASVRYIQPGASPWRGFGEVGIWGSPDITLGLDRSYVDTGRTVSAGGRSSASLASLYGRAGLLYTPSEADELALSASFTRNHLSFDGFRETAGADNLFAAKLGVGSMNVDVFAGEASWTHAVDEHLDFTLTGSLGTARGDDKALVADIDWVGAVDGGTQNRLLASAGGRVGWQFDKTWKVDATVSVPYIQGSGTTVDVGAALKAGF